MSNNTHDATSEETSVTVAVETAIFVATVEFIRCLTFYVAPVIAIAGILGNGVVIATLRSVPRTSSSWSLYVVAVNAVQALHLAVQLDTWTSDIGYGIYGVVGGWCQLVTFVSSATEFLVVWFCVLLGIDRAVAAIRRTRRAASILPCSGVVFARVALVSVGVLAVVVYVNVSLIYGEVRYGDSWSTWCLPLDAFDAAVRRLRLANAVLNSALPMLVLVPCVVIVALTAVLNRESHTSSLPRGRRIGRGEVGAVVLKLEGDRCSLLTLSTFLAFNIPVHGFRHYLTVTSFRNDGHVTLGDYLTLRALLMVRCLSESSNFFLFFVSSKLFRRTLIRRFKTAPKTKRRIIIFQMENR